MLSVIIPVYNGAGTIENTLRSIKEQSYKDYEVIIVNDGSVDESEKIVRDFAASDERFRLINQENGGVAAARNTGLGFASRKYVTFIDADDILPADAFMYMHQVAAVNDADTIVGMYERVDGTEKHINKRSRHLAEKSLRVYSDDYDLIHTWSLWNKWFDREIIEKNNIRFEKRKHLEDAVFVYDYLRYAKKIYTCPEIIYRYVKPLPLIGSTTTQRVNSALMKDARSALSRLEELTEPYGEDYHRELIYRYLNTPVIGDYYRRIWRFDDAGAEELTSSSDELLAMLDPERKQKLADRNKDIFAEDGARFLKRDELAEKPLVAIYLTDRLSSRGVQSIVTGLYDQSEVSFCIIADPSHKAALGDNYDGFLNFTWADGSGIASNINRTACKYAAVMDTDLIYNHGTLRAMIKALEADPSKQFVSMKFSRFDGSQVTKSQIISISFEDDAAAIDAYLANKLFRADQEAFTNAVDAMSASGAFAGDHYVRLTAPVMLSLTEDTEDQAKLPSAEAAKLYRECMKKRTPSLMKRAKSVARRILKGSDNKPNAPAKPAKSGKKLSASANFYLNTDIDPALIVIEALGKRAKGSSLYLLRELKKPEYSDFRIAFVVLEETSEFTKHVIEKEGLSNVSIVTAGSKEYKKALFTAHYLFNEVDFPNWWTKRPGQVYVNIWHGTPLKTLTKKTEGIVHHDATSSRNFTMADYMLFANDYSIEHILMDSDCGELTNTRGLMLGYPRTGVLFDSKMRDTVRSELCLEGKSVSIWMPTWNKDLTTDAANMFLRDVDERLTDDQLMYVNMHHKSPVVIDYSDLKHIRQFPEQFDIYEVLSAADILVTDYSSVFFDFAACRRKIILHCPDIDGYKASRGFNMDIRDLPFPITETVDDLIKELGSGKGYDDSGFCDSFNKYDSVRNAELLLRSMVLGDFSEVETRTFEKEENAVFLVADSFRSGLGTDLMYELSDSGKWPENVYLSFQEKVADADVDNIYPLLRNVRIFATKGKPLTERTERNRLYNTVDIKKFVLLDPADAARIRAFSCFPEKVCMILTERQADLIASGDKDMLKAVKRFVRYGDGVYTLDKAAGESLENFGIKTELISDADEFRELLS